MADTEETLTIAPPPALMISGTANRIIRKWLRRLTSYILLNSSMVVLRRARPTAIPTLLTRR
jgi:hypothetical protein